MGKGRVDKTCNVGYDVGLVSHFKVFLGGYLGHIWGGGYEGGGRGGLRAGAIQSGVEQKLCRNRSHIR